MGLLDDLKEVASKPPAHHKCPWCTTPGVAKEIAEALAWLATPDAKRVSFTDVWKAASARLPTTRTFGSFTYHCMNHGYADLWEAARRGNGS